MNRTIRNHPCKKSAIAVGVSAAVGVQGLIRKAIVSHIAIACCLQGCCGAGKARVELQFSREMSGLSQIASASM
jgi:hypothetical protein